MEQRLGRMRITSSSCSSYCSIPRTKRELHRHQFVPLTGIVGEHASSSSADNCHEDYGTSAAFGRSWPSTPSRVARVCHCTVPLPGSETASIISIHRVGPTHRAPRAGTDSLHPEPLQSLKTLKILKILKTLKPVINSRPLHCCWYSGKPAFSHCIGVAAKFPGPRLKEREEISDKILELRLGV